MPESKVKNLHVADSIDDLDKRCDLPDVKNKTTVMLVKSARGLYDEAEKYQFQGDEERAYILFMRFLGLIQRIKEASDYEKEKAYVKSMIGVSKCNKAFEHANKLKDNLILRYRVQQEKKIEKEKEKDVQMKSVKDVDVQENNIVSDTEMSIKPQKLFALLKDGSKNVLVLDVRSKECYDESHIKFSNCISIPEECIVAGDSANSLSKKLPEDSRTVWSKRNTMDAIIIYDWCSSEFSPGKTSNLLKIILTEWDPYVTYRCSPIILDGGYENWILTYPTFTTNPHATLPDRSNDLDDFLNGIDYPALDISPNDNNIYADRPAKPKKSEERNYLPTQNVAPKSSNPSIDRSSKNAAIQTYKEREKMIKLLLEEREKIAGKSLLIEKERVEAEERWGKLRNDTDTQIDNDVTNQLKEQELLSEIMQLESKQRDMALENKQLRDQLEEYRKREREEAKVVKPSDISSSSISSSSSTSPSSENISNGNLEENQDENTWNHSPETLDKEKKISDIEQEKAALAKKREILQADREKILAEAREQKKILNQKLEEEEENEYNKYPPPNVNQCKPEIPHFDRMTKPIQNIPYIPYTRERDFGDRRERVTPGLTGLKNLGLTCYMNSIIQCLNNTSYLADYFRRGEYKKHINYGPRNDSKGDRTNGAIAEEMAAVIQTLWSGQYRFISTRDLKNVVGKYKAMFRGSEQHDSHEFLVILMEWLHDDLQIPAKQHIAMNSLTPAEKAWLECTKSKESLIQRLFYGQIQSTVTCLQCGEKSVTYDSFSNLSLGLPADHSNRYSLKDCLELYLNGEEISDWQCPMCKSRRKAIRKLDLSKLPPVLIIHFNRFYQDYSTNICKKKQTYIDFPLENLTMYTCQDVSVTYNLYGVSNHYGTMESGHYTAYCKSGYDRSSFSWYKFDDHLVTPISPSDVKSSAAYILFYTSHKKCLQ